MQVSEVRPRVESFTELLGGREAERTSEETRKRERERENSELVPEANRRTTPSGDRPANRPGREKPARHKADFWRESGTRV